MKKLLGLSMILIFSHYRSAACDCNPESDNYNFIKSQIVQTSRIHSYYVDKDGDWKVKLKGITSHKGTETLELYLHGMSQTTSCAIELKLGSVWLLFIITDTRKGKNYLLPCSGSRSLAKDKPYPTFDSTLIYDTTVVRMDNSVWPTIFINHDGIDLQLLLDSCTSTLKLEKKVVVNLIISRHGVIKCDTLLFRPIEPELVRQIDAFFEDKKIEPRKVNGTYVNIQVRAVIKNQQIEPH
ncbi:MAG TPA: hypothetical protein DIW47_09625 [Bacteroidetes bacterium]|nr:hypothetical protein [Bacteroidota bacterium]